MTRGNPFRLVLKFALPLFFGNLLQQFYNLADHLFTGKKSKLGCLFSLKSSDYRMPSQNIAIYGHHLSHSNAMFSSLIVMLPKNGREKQKT